MAFRDNFFLKRDSEAQQQVRKKRPHPVERRDKETQTERGDRDVNVKEVWEKVDKKASEQEPITIMQDIRPGWKTVRIFVSSTFKDFHQEREILVKEVFAELRRWCEARQLHLIDCDLRWGVPEGADFEFTVRTCLEEIDRCIEYNKAPYFINLTCKRVGWIPSKEELSAGLWKQYDLPFGLSVTEMEIVHAAYCRNNPNALFLFRDDSFLEDVREKAIRERFIDEEEKAEEKLKVLKEKIKNRFHKGFKTYKCKYVPGENLYGKYASKGGKAVGVGIPKLEVDQGLFEEVRKFFEERIELQYPVVMQEDVNDFARFKTHHEDFMTSRCRSGERNKKDSIIGREGVLKQIDDYITSDTSGHPLLIIGDAGSGKSTIMAKAVSDALVKIESKGQTGNQSCNGWKIFFHFVGAVPKSTSLLWILRRLLKELNPSVELPETIQDTAVLVRKELSTASTPTVIFIDALNQIDKETQIESTFWLPERLSSNVHCVISLITNSEPHRALQKRNSSQPDNEGLAQDAKINPENSTPDFKSRPEIMVPDLDPLQLISIINNYLSHFNKKLDSEQVLVLLNKASSKNPLWLRIACEELRVYGDFRSVNDFITGIPDGLPDLLKQVLKRFEAETDRILLGATICLLEVSKFGLLEAELLEILADKDHLDYSQSSKTEENPEQLGAIEKGSRLPYVEWAGVYRNLRLFLRPYGNPNEGRLDFYHRTLSKVVQDKYLDKNKSEAEYNKKCWWWHKKLAEYYRHRGTPDRKVEEYPHHLLFLRQYSADEEDQKRYSQWLQEFLQNRDAFERLYDNEFSADLLFYWRESGDKDYAQMCTQYLKLSEEIEANPDSVYRCKTMEQFSRVMGQGGRYAEALQMAERCVEMLKNPSNEMEKKDRDEKMVSIYSNIGHIKSIISQEVPVYHEIIGIHKTVIQIIRDNNWEDETRFKKLTALQFNKIAYVCGEIYRLDGSEDILAEGIKNVEQAIKLYTELEDFAHELEAQLTKATLYRDTPEEQLKIYKLTRQKARQMFGKEHHLMCRLSFNTAIAHEAADDLDNAYKYFRKAYDLGLKVYGPKHASTEMYRDTICEEKFARIGRRLGHTVD